ncbi:hypothetical protein AB0D11_47625 [Streptomyces monashensis]|uniref:hypothetical protein n=1 Tax=Streptomyces monashensis TaxID=1678012 RepID=UPI0033FE4A22
MPGESEDVVGQQIVSEPRIAEAAFRLLQAQVLHSGLDPVQIAQQIAHPADSVSEKQVRDHR